jgi:hypothetical protein
MQKTEEKETELTLYDIVFLTLATGFLTVMAWLTFMVGPQG